MGYKRRHGGIPWVTLERQIREPKHPRERVLLNTFAENLFEFGPGDRVEVPGGAVVDRDRLGRAAPVGSQVVSHDAHLKHERDTNLRRGDDLEEALTVAAVSLWLQTQLQGTEK